MDSIGHQTSTMKVAIIGGGNFGTAIGNMVAENGHQAVLWMRDQQRAEHIQRTRKNESYLPEVQLHPNLKIIHHLPECLEKSELIFIAVPSQAFRETCRQIQPLLQASQGLISTAKGIEEPGFKLMSQVMAEELPGQPIGVLSGPNLAKEITARTITGTVIASDHIWIRESVQKALHCPYFRVFASEDMYGVELGGSLKNIYAIAAGMAGAKQVGENSRGLLITRSLTEMSRLAVRLGANPLTFLGLAGVGDLVVTCSSSLSRNYQVGFALASGKTLQEAVDELGSVAEGINTLKLVKAKAQELSVAMPIVNGLYQVIFNQRGVDEVVDAMMLKEGISQDVAFVLPARKDENE